MTFRMKFRSGSQKAIIAVLAAGALVTTVAVGSGVAVWQGWLEIPGVSFGKQAPPTIEEMLENMKQVESADVTVSLEVITEERDVDVKPLEVSDDKRDLVEATRSFPTDMELRGTVTSRWSGGFAGEDLADIENLDLDQATQITGTYKSDGLSVELDVESLTADEMTYVRINTFPSVFFDISSISDQWIALPELDSTDPISVYSSYLNVTEEQVLSTKQVALDESAEKVEEEESSPIQEAREQTDQLVQEAKDLFALAMANEAATVEHRESTDDNWNMRLRLHPDTFRALYLEQYELHKDSIDTEKPSFYDEEVYEFMTDEDASSVTDLVLENTVVDFSVSKDTRIPSRMAISSRVAPPDSVEKYDGLQLRTTLAVELDNVNAPQEIVAPEDSMPVREAVRLFRGISVEEVQFEQQSSNIDDIRTALDKYKEEQGEYPADLNTVVGFEYVRYSFAPETVSYVMGIPNDVYTDAALGYTSAGDTYELKYTMQIEDTISSYTASRYVEGENTATQSSVSVEAEATKDTDGDGLTDAEEAELGTNIWYEDSDFDGYTDKEEVDGGFDPLTGSGGTSSARSSGPDYYYSDTEYDYDDIFDQVDAEFQ